MAVASLQESVTVTGEAPRVDQPGQQRRLRGTAAQLAAPPPPPMSSAAPAGIVGGAARPYPDALGRGRYAAPFNTEAYDPLDENAFRRVADDPLSTFSIDVDTASYANVRRFLNDGRCRPPTPCASRS